MDEKKKKRNIQHADMFSSSWDSNFQRFSVSMMVFSLTWYHICLASFAYPMINLFLNDLQLQKFRDELKNRSRVLKKLGHIDADGVVQLKGRAACLVDTGDELLVTELMFNGKFLITLTQFLCIIGVKGRGQFLGKPLCFTLEMTQLTGSHYYIC